MAWRGPFGLCLSGHLPHPFLGNLLGFGRVSGVSRPLQVQAASQEHQSLITGVRKPHNLSGFYQPKKTPQRNPLENKQSGFLVKQ